MNDRIITGTGGGLEVFSIFEWYEFIIIVVILFVVFKYFGKHFRIDEDDK